MRVKEGGGRGLIDARRRGGEEARNVRGVVLGLDRP